MAPVLGPVAIFKPARQTDKRAVPQTDVNVQCRDEKKWHRSKCKRVPCPAISILLFYAKLQFFRQIEKELVSLHPLTILDHF